MTVMAVPPPEEPGPDLYQLLGVARDAPATDIAHAYRRKARGTHPDSRPRDADAPARFRALAEAYQVLSDPTRRAAYDRALRPQQTAGGLRVQARTVPGPPLWAGPVRVDPLAGRPAADDPPAAGPAPSARSDEQLRLQLLAELISCYLAVTWDRPW